MKLKAERDAFKTVKQESIAAHKEKLAVSFDPLGQGMGLHCRRTEQLKCQDY